MTDPSPPSPDATPTPSRCRRMEDALRSAFEPTLLDVIDESELHRGHAGWSDAGETHFRIRISAPVFDGRSRVERHRMVNAALAREFETGLHALSLEIV